jgi:hypothetical protein
MVERKRNMTFFVSSLRMVERAWWNARGVNDP